MVSIKRCKFRKLAPHKPHCPWFLTVDSSQLFDFCDLLQTKLRCKNIVKKTVTAYYQEPLYQSTFSSDFILFLNISRNKQLCLRDSLLSRGLGRPDQLDLSRKRLCCVLTISQKGSCCNLIKFKGSGTRFKQLSINYLGNSECHISSRAIADMGPILLISNQSCSLSLDLLAIDYHKGASPKVL